MKRVSPFVLLACVSLAACDSAPGPYERSTSFAQQAPAPVMAPVGVSAAPISTPMSLNLANFMYGPPPHNRIDPRMRCRFDCPKYPADLPPPVAPAR